MSNMFLKAIKYQDNLDKVMPYRNHPLTGLPTEKAVRCIKLFRDGLTPKQITEVTGYSYHSVSSTIRRCNVEPSYKPHHA